MIAFSVIAFTLRTTTPLAAGTKVVEKVAKEVVQKVNEVTEEMEKVCLQSPMIKKFIDMAWTKNRDFFKKGGRLEVEIWYTIKKEKGAKPKIHWKCRIVSKRRKTRTYLLFPKGKGEQKLIRE